MSIVYPPNNILTSPAPVPPFYGAGTSNQNYSNSPANLNTGPGLVIPNPQGRLYVPDLTGEVDTLLLDVGTINGQITIIQGDIVTINAALAGTVTTVGPIGAVPNANGASIAAQTLTLQPADATFGGVLTAGTQSIAGDKTITGALTGLHTVSAGTNLDGQYITLPLTASDTVGTIQMNGARFLHSGSTTTSTFCGPQSGNHTASVGQSVGIGYQALLNTSGGLSANNTCIGYQSARLMASAHDNVCIGYESGATILTGARNVLIGIGAGNALVNSVTDAICISNDGTHGTSGSIMIGTIGVQTSLFIACPLPNSNPASLGMVIDSTSSEVRTIALPVNSLIAPGAAVNLLGGVINPDPTGNILQLSFADLTHPGIMDINAQSFAGVKYLQDGIKLGVGGAGNTLAYFDKVTGSFTPTLTGGAAITTMLVRGGVSATIPYTLTRIDGLCTLNFAYSKVTVVGAGSVNNFLITGAGSVPAAFRPAFDTVFPIVILTGGTQVSALLYIGAAGGDVSIQKLDGTTLAVNFGTIADTTVVWQH